MITPAHPAIRYYGDTMSKLPRLYSRCPHCGAHGYPDRWRQAFCDKDCHDEYLIRRQQRYAIKRWRKQHERLDAIAAAKGGK